MSYFAYECELLRNKDFRKNELLHYETAILTILKLPLRKGKFCNVENIFIFCWLLFFFPLYA